jgi:hypothetical protein
VERTSSTFRVEDVSRKEKEASREVIACYMLARLIFRSCRCEQYIPPKRRLISIVLGRITSEKFELFYLHYCWNMSNNFGKSPLYQIS